MEPNSRLHFPRDRLCVLGTKTRLATQIHGEPLLVLDIGLLSFRRRKVRTFYTQEKDDDAQIQIALQNSIRLSNGPRSYLLRYATLAL